MLRHSIPNSSTKKGYPHIVLKCLCCRPANANKQKGSEQNISYFSSCWLLLCILFMANIFAVLFSDTVNVNVNCTWRRNKHTKKKKTLTGSLRASQPEKNLFNQNNIHTQTPRSTQYTHPTHPTHPTGWWKS